MLNTYFIPVNASRIQLGQIFSFSKSFWKGYFSLLSNIDRNESNVNYNFIKFT